MHFLPAHPQIMNLIWMILRKYCSPNPLRFEFPGSCNSLIYLIHHIIILYSYCDFLSLVPTWLLYYYYDFSFTVFAQSDAAATIISLPEFVWHLFESGIY